MLAAEGWHPGVIGIVASRIAESYHRPAILISLDGELGTGSGRSIPGFDLLGALHAAAGHLERYGGHRAAAGLTIRRDRVEELRAAIEAHAEAVLTPDLLQPVERIDAIVSGTDLGLGFAEELESLAPCGMGNPHPKLLVPGARFKDPRPMGEGRHLRFTVTSGGTRARAVSFGCDGRLGVEAETPVDASFRLELNAYNGAVEPRLLLRHARPCAPEPIDVLGESDHYLAAVFDELDRSLDSPAANDAAGATTVLDRRSESALAVLADAIAAGGRVLAVCADVQQAPERPERAGRRLCADLLSRPAIPSRDHGRVRARGRPGSSRITGRGRAATWRAIYPPGVGRA